MWNRLAERIKAHSSPRFEETQVRFTPCANYFYFLARVSKIFKSLFFQLWSNIGNMQALFMIFDCFVDFFFIFFRFFNIFLIFLQQFLNIFNDPFWLFNLFLSHILGINILDFWWVATEDDFTHLLRMQWNKRFCSSV